MAFGGKERGVQLAGPTDVVAGAKWMKKNSQRLEEQLQAEGYRDKDPGQAELFSIDLADAFCHWPVCQEELANCVAPHVEPDKYVVFVALLFGFKGAPLLMGRLSAAIGRYVPLPIDQRNLVEETLSSESSIETQRQNMGANMARQALQHFLHLPDDAIHARERSRSPRGYQDIPSLNVAPIDIGAAGLLHPNDEEVTLPPAL